MQVPEQWRFASAERFASSTEAIIHPSDSAAWPPAQGLASNLAAAMLTG